ncbi:hypothetical protein HRR75_005714 [Exophiala dermatitidis]|nr:hypothetical protein HRR75_005714 [Exophiala dermatitidis]
MPSSRKRPAKRNLVRWSDDLDKGVLLAIQYASAEAGIKLPCKHNTQPRGTGNLADRALITGQRVAELMGPKFSEGAIVQHLAKLRSIMASEGIPVPPPLRRGMITRTPSKVYTTATPKHKLESFSPMYTGTPEHSDMETTLYDHVEEGSPSPMPKGNTHDPYDSDGDEFVSPKKKARKSKAGICSRASKTMQKPPSTPQAQTIKVEQGDDSISTFSDDTGGPATRTRGIKRDYSAMQATSSEEESPDGRALNVHVASGAEESVKREDNSDASEEEPKAVARAAQQTTDAAAAADLARLQSEYGSTPQVPTLTVPYGQIRMVDGMTAGVSNAQVSYKREEGWDITDSAKMPMYPATSNINASFLGPPINNFSYGGNLTNVGAYSAGQTAFYGPPMMNNFLPFNYQANSMVPSTAPPNTDSRVSTRNNSVTTAISHASLTSLSDTLIKPQSPQDIARRVRQTETEGVTEDHDMNANLPSSDIIWSDTVDGGFLADDSA